MSTKDNLAETPQSTTQHITPSQRAAVVIAMLGETAAKPIVEMLDDEAIANIAASLETITVLAREQLIEIVIDFLRQLRMNSGSLRGGSDSARKILEGVLDADDWWDQVGRQHTRRRTRSKSRSGPWSTKKRKRKSWPTGASSWSGGRSRSRSSSRSRSRSKGGFGTGGGI